MQHNLELFNDKFDSLILAFPFQLFVMILALFVSVVRGEMANQLELITFVATGGQYLVRSFIGLLNMGKVHGKNDTSNYERLGKNILKHV